MVLPTDQIRDAEGEVVILCGSGLVHEQLFRAALPESLDEMQHLGGHGCQRTCETLGHRPAANAPRVTAEGFRTLRRMRTQGTEPSSFTRPHLLKMFEGTNLRYAPDTC